MSQNDLGKYKRTKIIFFLLAVYVIFQLLWWVFHLVDLHGQLFDMELKLAETDDTGEVLHRYSKKVTMIVGEGAVFIMLLVLGIWRIRRNLRKEELLASQEKNFILAITHELKTPVASIRLFLDTLKKRELPREKQVEFLEDASLETHRLDQLVENILLSTRLEQDQFFGHFEILNFTELIQNVAQRFQKSLVKKHRLTLDLVDDAMLEGDRISLELLVSNLYENAVKYGGAEPEVHLSLSKESDAFVLRVEDKGLGIPPEERELIFRKFYRMGSEDTRSAKGTGIGLYMVQQIVKLHRAKLILKQNKPQGAIFEIQFTTHEAIK